jgi:shikimate dehydrogenase
VGFLLMLRLADIEVNGKKILVLGGGGSGRSTAAALKNAGATVHVYQRRREKLEELCNELGVTPADDPEKGGYDVIVNCTGVGMHDSEGQSPATKQAFLGATHAIDLIYTPTQSEFLRLAKSVGVSTLNGAAMLFYQAYYADCIYLGREPNDAEAKKLYEEFSGGQV